MNSLQNDLYSILDIDLSRITCNSKDRRNILETLVHPKYLTFHTKIELHDLLEVQAQSSPNNLAVLCYPRVRKQKTKGSCFSRSKWGTFLFHVLFYLFVFSVHMGYQF